jgi:hypothetical protein
MDAINWPGCCRRRLLLLLSFLPQLRQQLTRELDEQILGQFLASLPELAYPLLIFLVVAEIPTTQPSKTRPLQTSSFDRFPSRNSTHDADPTVVRFSFSFGNSLVVHFLKRKGPLPRAAPRLPLCLPHRALNQAHSACCRRGWILLKNIAERWWTRLSFTGVRMGLGT